MSFNFSTVEKVSGVRGDSYKGMSINESGSYITKTLRRDNDLDQYNGVEMQVDVANNAVLLKFHEEYNPDLWKMNKSQEGITLTMKAKNVNLPKGRYEVVQDNGDQIILKFNPQI